MSHLMGQTVTEVSDVSLNVDDTAAPAGRILVARAAHRRPARGIFDVERNENVHLVVLHGPFFRQVLGLPAVVNGQPVPGLGRGNEPEIDRVTDGEVDLFVNAPRKVDTVDDASLLSVGEVLLANADDIDART